MAADDLPALAELNGEGSYKSMSASGLPERKASTNASCSCSGCVKGMVFPRGEGGAAATGGRGPASAMPGQLKMTDSVEYKKRVLERSRKFSSSAAMPVLYASDVNQLAASSTLATHSSATPS